MAAMAQIYPLQILIASLAGLINRRQAEVLEYLIEENRVLKKQMKGRKLRLTDEQRRRLAAKEKRIGRRLLMQVATIVTPDTILRWHQRLIKAKWTYEAKRVGRPGLMKEIGALIVRFARENCGRGYTRIEGALRNVGHRVAPTTIPFQDRDGGRWHRARQDAVPGAECQRVCRALRPVDQGGVSKPDDPVW